MAAKYFYVYMYVSCNFWNFIISKLLSHYNHAFLSQEYAMLTRILAVPTLWTWLCASSSSNATVWSPHYSSIRYLITSKTHFEKCVLKIINCDCIINLNLQQSLLVFLNNYGRKRDGTLYIKILNVVCDNACLEY